MQPLGLQATKMALLNAVQSLSRYGRPRSRSTCGYAASQCFASLMVDVMGTESNQPSEWQVKLDQAILEIRQTRPQELSPIRGANMYSLIWAFQVICLKDRSTTRVRRVLMMLSKMPWWPLSIFLVDMGLTNERHLQKF